MAKILLGFVWSTSKPAQEGWTRVPFAKPGANSCKSHQWSTSRQSLKSNSFFAVDRIFSPASQHPTEFICYAFITGLDVRFSWNFIVVNNFHVVLLTGMTFFKYIK